MKLKRFNENNTFDLSKIEKYRKVNQEAIDLKVEISDRLLFIVKEYYYDDILKYVDKPNVLGIEWNLNGNNFDIDIVDNMYDKENFELYPIDYNVLISFEEFEDPELYQETKRFGL